MLAVDTNVLLRLLVRDDPKQAQSADQFVAKGAWVFLIVWCWKLPARLGTCRWGRLTGGWRSWKERSVCEPVSGHYDYHLAPRSGRQGDEYAQAELVPLAAQQVACAGLRDAKAPHQVRTQPGTILSRPGFQDYSFAAQIEGYKSS